MFCTNCGSELGDGDKFCARCGMPVEPINPDVTAEPAGDAVTSGHGTSQERPVAGDGAAEAPRMTDVDLAEAISGASTAEPVPLALEVPSEEPAHEEEAEPSAPPVTQLADATSEQPTPPVGTPDSRPQPTEFVSPYGAGHSYGVSQTTNGGMESSDGTPVQAPAQKVPWHMTIPGRLAMGTVGLVLIISGIAKMVGACTPSGGDSKPPIEKTDTTKRPTDMSSPSDDKDKEKKDDKTDEKDDGTGKPGDGDHDVIIADDDDIIIADDDDIIIRDKTNGSDDVDYGGGEKFDSWAEECTDKDGNPTVYAISELKGWQLETLCQEKGLKWDDQRLEWDGKNGYALVVYDKNHQRIDDEDIAKLGKAADNDNVVYEIQSEGHNGVEDAYKEFVEAIMVSEDSEVMTDKMLVGVAYGPSMSRLLVPVYKGSVVPYSMTQVFSEKAIKAGVYDEFNDPSQAYPERDTYGDTVPKVFESVTGRKLGSNH